MKFKREQIINALCNEYNHLFKDTYIPGIDLSFNEYKKAWKQKPLMSLSRKHLQIANIIHSKILWNAMNKVQYAKLF